MIDTRGRPAYFRNLVRPCLGPATLAQLPPDPTELPDDDIIPDETPPLPPDEPVKTDPIPEEAP